MLIDAEGFGAQILVHALTDTSILTTTQNQAQHTGEKQEQVNKCH